MLIWKRIYEEEVGNVKAKKGVSVAMLDQDYTLVDVCAMTKNKVAQMLAKVAQEKEVSPT